MNQADCVVKSDDKARQEDLFSIERPWPESKCTNLSYPALSFYQNTYSGFGIDYQNCLPANKVFVLDDKCSKFVQKYNTINCPQNEVCNYHHELRKNLPSLIDSALNECSQKYGTCAVYNVNNIPYRQSSSYLVYYIMSIVLLIVVIFALLLLPFGIYFVK